MKLTPRHEWIQSRIHDVVLALKALENEKDWESYRKKANEFGKELVYLTVEWEKHYNPQ